MRIVVSRKQIDRALYALPARDHHLVTVQGILSSLQRLVGTSGCRVIGYQTVELDMFVTVQSMSTIAMMTSLNLLYSSSIDHSMLCTREAEKIVTLIRTQSPRIVSDVALSTLIGAQLIPLYYDDQRDISESANSGCSINVPGLSFLLILFRFNAFQL